MQSVETSNQLKQMFGVRPETPIPQVVASETTYTSFNPTDVQVDMTQAPQYTESQLKYQRMLLPEMKGERKPGERLKSSGVHLQVLGISTVADLAESHLVDWLVRDHKLFNQKTEAYKEADFNKAQDFPEEVKNSSWYKVIEEKQTKSGKGIDFAAMKEAVKDAAQLELGFKGAAEFMEESGTDSLMAGLANAWVRHMTGVEGAKYVSETSAFIADWFIVWAQVFNNNALYPKQGVTKEVKFGKEVEVAKKRKFNIKLAYEAADFVNPVNVEALIRLTEEMPVVGDGIAWAHQKLDHFLETKFMSKVNWLASKGFLGYHIGKNMKAL